MKAGIHIHTSDVKTTFQKLEANLLKNGVDTSANFKITIKSGERGLPMRSFSTLRS